jgi:hypothetical protein
MATRLIALPPSRFLIIATTLLMFAVLFALAVLTPYGIYNLKCERFDMPAYEKTFGFTLGGIDTPGGTDKVLGIAAVVPNGIFARSGLRPGDVPRMHHGVSELCGDLSAALSGRAVELRVYNPDDARAGKESARDVRLRVE